MLMQIGPVQFTVTPMNTHAYARDTAADYASKAIVGARPPLEFMGAGEETMKISGKLFPKRLGGLDDLATLNAMEQVGIPQLVLRGDGKVYGWFVIVAITETSTYLDASGVGQVIDIEVSLKKAAAPSPVGFALALFGTFP